MQLHRVCLAGAFWLLASTAALSQELPELLMPAVPKGTERSLTDARVLRSRFVELNRESLMSAVDARRRVVLNLFDDARWNVEEIKGYWSRDKSTFLWHGRIESMERGFVVIGITGDIASAQIHTDLGDEYQIRWVAGTLHTIQQVDPDAPFAREDTVAVPASELAPDKDPERLAAEAPRNAAGDTVVDLLVAYTPAARDAAGGDSAIRNSIQTTVASANQAFTNSGVQIEFSLVHMMLVNYDEAGGDVTTALAPLRNTNDGVMDEVHAARNTYGADLVSLWIQGSAGGPWGGTVGYGYQLASPVSTSFAPWAFNTVERYWAPSLTMAHELGHNMGAQHDRANSSNAGAYSYSYGYQNAVLGSAFRTIMAYQCAAMNCPKIPYWSNPVVSYNGTPTGIASNQSNSADNAQTLNNTRATVANFRAGASGCTYSISPASATVSSSSGTGTVTVTAASGCAWTASTGTSWLQVTSGASGTGNGSVGYSYTANASTSSRSGSITIAGITFQVTQNGSSGSTVAVTVNSAPSGLSVTVGGTPVTTPYTVNWPSGANLTLNAPTTQGSGGTRYNFVSWSNGGPASQTVTPSSATTYTVTYQTQYLLTATPSPGAGGSLAIAPSSADGYYNSGAGVQISAVANSGYNFSSWTGSVTGSTNPVAVTMDSAKNITANFTSTSSNVSITITSQPTGLNITVDGASYTTPQTFTWSSGSTHTVSAAAQQGGSSTRYNFLNWSNGGTASQTITTPSSATTYTANYQTQHKLTASVTGSGSVTANPSSADGFYNANTSVQLTASPSAGSQFNNWSGALTGNTNPSAVLMDAPKTVTANFATASGSYTVTSSPAGLSITVDGVPVTTPQTFNWTPGTSHTLTAPSMQGTGGTRYLYSSWAHGGGITQTITAPPSPATYTANYQTQHQLSISVNGNGSVTAVPASAEGFYNAGTSVQLTANPGSGSQFGGWSGSLTGTANPATLTMDSPKSVTAAFGTASSGITITTAPAGLQILVDGIAYTSPQTFNWSTGSAHTIGVNSPQGNSQTRYVFANWSDGGAVSHSITTPATATTYIASFTTQYALGVVISPVSSGSVSQTPASPDGFYNAGTSVQLTAQPLVTYNFTGWTGDLTGTSNPGTVVMNGARNITANFSRASTCGYTLSQNETTVSAPGDVRTVNVTSAPECTWSVQSVLTWVQITSGTQGNGNGIVRMLIGANTTGAARTGVVTIAGIPYTITQAAATCSFQLTGPGGTIPAAGGSFTIGVTTTAGCQWSAAKSSAWITWNGPTSGTSSGSVGFTAAANSSAVPRTATITIGGITLHFVQKGQNTPQIFNDVLASNLFFDYITLLGLSSIPDSCGTGAYCPDSTINRASMAVFLVRSLVGDSFAFTQTPYFSDVSPSHPQFSYIQKLRDLGVTNGCGNGQYCPADPVTRGQMAAFIVRARLGVTFSQTFPYNVAQPFADVDSNSIFFAYIQKLRELGITTGCSATAFCPNDPNTRGQMGAFVARGFF